MTSKACDVQRSLCGRPPGDELVLPASDGAREPIREIDAKPFGGGAGGAEAGDLSDADAT